MTRSRSGQEGRPWCSPCVRVCVSLVLSEFLSQRPWVKKEEKKDVLSSPQQVLLGGHDLDRHNLQGIRDLPGLLEVSIGHAQITRALDVGTTQSIRELLQALGWATPSIS